MGFPGEELLVFYFCPRKGLFSAAGVRETPSQGAVLALAEKMAETMRIETKDQWETCAGARRTPSQEAALALAAKTAEASRIETTSLWGPCKARLQAKAKRQAAQWIDGPSKTSNDGVGKKDLGAKPRKYESVGRRKAP